MREPEVRGAALLASTSRPDRRYCSTLCRVTAHERRRREEEKEETSGLVVQFEHVLDRGRSSSWVTIE